jgi:membrane associated rhomboid family serine protease
MTGESFPDRFQRWYRMLPPALRVLMTVNTVLYVAWVLVGLLRLAPVSGFVLSYLALTPALPEAAFRPWQVLTYGFLHVQPGLWGFISFGFNMLWLYWLGREYEEFYGSHRLFGLYVVSTVAGGLLAVAASAVLPMPDMPVAGAMAAVLGVICGIATMNPDRGIALFFLGVVKMKWVAVGFLVLMVLFSWTIWSFVFAYLGGAAMGFLFIRAQQRNIDLAAWARPLFRGQRSPYGGYAPAPAGGGTFQRVSGWLGKRQAPVEEARSGGRRRAVVE